MTTLIYKAYNTGTIWNQVLNEHRVTRAEVLQSFATLAEGAALVAADIAHGIEYQQWVG